MASGARPRGGNTRRALAGIDLIVGNTGAEAHCAQFTQWTTGITGQKTVPNYTAARAASFDQLVAAEPSITAGTRFASLQLAGDMTAVGGDISHRYMSWANGFDKPLPGEHLPMNIYRLLFGNFTPDTRDTGVVLTQSGVKGGASLSHTLGRVTPSGVRRSATGRSRKCGSRTGATWM